MTEEMKTLIRGLTSHLGREPSKKELHILVYGTEDQRVKLWS